MASKRAGWQAGVNQAVASLRSESTGFNFARIAVDDLHDDVDDQ